MAFGDPDRLVTGDVCLERPESREGMLNKTISAWRVCLQLHGKTGLSNL